MTRSSLQRAVIAAPALLCAAVIAAAVTPGFVTVTRLEPTSWHLVGVDGRHLTVYIRSAGAGCGQVADLRLFQTADSVTLAAFRKTGDDFCASAAAPAVCKRVKLHRPLGDRLLVHNRISATIGPEVEDLAVTAGLVGSPYTRRCDGVQVDAAEVQPFANRAHVAGSSGLAYS